MRRKKRRNKTNKNLKKLIILIFIIIVFVIVKKLCISEDSVLVSKTVEFKTQLLETIENSKQAEITEYFVYGTHFNLEGTMQIDGDVINNVDLIMKNTNGEEILLNTEYSVEDNIVYFSTAKVINNGIDLETISESNYYILLRITSNEYDKYYSLVNSTSYEEIEYYTITKNNTNNKISINFEEYNYISLLNVKVNEIDELPEEVYDVVIDAGHGGIDAGAVYSDYKESEIVLSCAKNLKEKLEDLGLKVLLTRDGTEDEDSNMAYNMYDDDGRITKAMESNAKILLSLHMNSNTEKLTTGGVEIYAPSNCDLIFARLLADNIVTKANTNYSYLETYKQADGVYIHNYSEYEISLARSKAISEGYTMYDITTSTPYLYMIRETGGIATGAYVDGRNTDYAANKYYNSNIGIESYLIELGYIIVNEDLENILNNEDLYVQSIADSIESFYLKQNN